MISIVIPSKGEGEELLSCLAATAGLDGAFEMVVASHGESGETGAEARRVHPHVQWLDCPLASRGDQMNRGAVAARGDGLIFLHADTRLPAGAVGMVTAALSRPGVAGGAFRLAFDVPHPVLGGLSFLSRLPWRRAYFGDQAMFCPRAAFEDAGGFPRTPLFGDVELALALARRGRLMRIPARVTTSSRRFLAAGPARQVMRNAALLALHAAGVPGEALARHYER